jgi:hypothetical protein
VLLCADTPTLALPKPLPLPLQHQQQYHQQQQLQQQQQNNLSGPSSVSDDVKGEAPPHFLNEQLRQEQVCARL